MIAAVDVAKNGLVNCFELKELGTRVLPNAAKGHEREVLEREVLEKHPATLPARIRRCY